MSDLKYTTSSTLLKRANTVAELGDLPSNGVNVIVQNKLGHYLLVHDGKKWSLPGGGIKQGETSNRAALRETLEETGLMVIGKLILVADVQLVIKWKHKVLLFKAIDWNGIINPLMKDEIREARFFKPEQIKDNPDIYRAQRVFIQIFETAYLKLPLPVYALASDPPVIEW
ncbi:MAG: hypothetical protein A2918_02810 [Candidatus Yanofskybacteria bacterium RIFCSPLOWO2_01_FULL_42_49]|uniref:Nudix hydrolase domain-containing protein n=1 Tax=Candidatus Yanofskybacteria bacterium RIFCSPLOWO2_01_FULL_42_49 TaxID=1802694 RepID=A0A1F8GE90_9BACT|nr:MAG: hypothetical protein A2918_02810 [Candidatus Yanofskybacteria bacterium RIFCSPLOWO2_01_FULL_42_49]